MELIIFLILIIGTLFFISKTFKITTKNKIKWEEKNPSKLYKKRPLSNPEQIMYFRLKKALPEYEILPQVSFSRFLYTEGGSNKENFSKFGRVRQKVIDYLICDKSLEIIVAIEIDDKSHNKEKDILRDKLLIEADIRTIRWNVKNLPTEDQITKRIKSFIFVQKQKTTNKRKTKEKLNTIEIIAEYRQPKSVNN